MKYILTLALILSSFLVESYATNLTQDQDYVWARSGLNVRSGPGTTYGIVAKIEFGDAVTVLSETDVTYNISGISNVDTVQYYYSRYEKKAPYILYGNWIEIYTSSGKIGFVVSQYIIDIKPNLAKLEFPFEEVSRDTFSVYDEIESFELSIGIEFENGIKGGITGSQGCYGEYITFPNHTMQEAFIMLMPNKIRGLKVMRNWPNKLILDDGSMNTITIEMNDGILFFSRETCC